MSSVRSFDTLVTVAEENAKENEAPSVWKKYLSWVCSYERFTEIPLQMRRCRLVLANYLICTLGVVPVLVSLRLEMNIGTLTNLTLFGYSVVMLLVLHYRYRIYKKQRTHTPEEHLAYEVVPNWNLVMNFSVYVPVLCLQDLDANARLAGGVWPLFLVVLGLMVFMEFPYKAGLHVAFVVWVLIVCAESTTRFGLFDIPGTYPAEDRRERVDCTTLPCKHATTAFTFAFVKFASYGMVYWFMLQYTKMMEHSKNEIKKDAASMEEIIDATVDAIDELMRLRLDHATVRLGKLEELLQSRKDREHYMKLHTGLGELLERMERYMVMFPEPAMSSVALPDKDVCVLSVRADGKEATQRARELISGKGQLEGYAFESDVQKDDNEWQSTFTAVFKEKGWWEAYTAAFEVLKETGDKVSLALAHFASIEYNNEDQVKVDSLRHVAKQYAVVASDEFVKLEDIHFKEKATAPIVDRLPGEVPFCNGVRLTRSPPGWLSKKLGAGRGQEGGEEEIEVASGVHYLYPTETGDETLDELDSSLVGLTGMDSPEEVKGGKMRIRVRVDFGEKVEEVWKALKEEGQNYEAMLKEGLGNMGSVNLTWQKEQVHEVVNFANLLCDKVPGVRVLAVLGDVRPVITEVVGGSHFKMMDALVGVAMCDTKPSFIMASQTKLAVGEADLLVHYEEVCEHLYLYTRSNLRLNLPNGVKENFKAAFTPPLRADQPPLPLAAPSEVPESVTPGQPVEVPRVPDPDFPPRRPAVDVATYLNPLIPLPKFGQPTASNPYGSGAACS